jgi:hypothetical protein
MLDLRFNLRRIVTTNSISQVFQRRVMERHLRAKKPISLVMAVPDHPWTKATDDAAAVRIAMTVGESGTAAGTLREVVRESGLDTDAPQIDFKDSQGSLNSDLTIGVDLTTVVPLLAAEGLASRGVTLAGSGFIVNPQEAEHLALGKRSGLDQHIRAFRNGRDLNQTSRQVYVIDLLGLNVDEVRQRFPEVYQHLLRTVKPERDSNNRESYRQYWWIFAEPRKEMRPRW